MSGNNDDNNSDVSNIEQSIIEKKKHEYYLLGKFNRRRGLTLFSYDSHKKEILQVKSFFTASANKTIHLKAIHGRLVPIDLYTEKILIDSRLVYFECLNLDNAKKRVNNFLNGKIKDLCNLTPYNENAISLY